MRFEMGMVVVEGRDIFTVHYVLGHQPHWYTVWAKDELDAWLHVMRWLQAQGHEHECEES